MDREKFIEKKQLEIQEEVDFLRTEKRDVYRKSDILYDEIRDKIAELKHCVQKEKIVNQRLSFIDESGAMAYGISMGYSIGLNYSINSSLINLNNLAKSTFDIEEFGGLLEEEEKKEVVKFKTAAAMERENNQLLSSMVSILKQIEGSSKDVTVDSKKLTDLMQSQYNLGGRQ